MLPQMNVPEPRMVTHHFVQVKQCLLPGSPAPGASVQSGTLQSCTVSRVVMQCLKIDVNC